jgi:hypothetical protein
LVACKHAVKFTSRGRSNVISLDLPTFHDQKNGMIMS